MKVSQDDSSFSSGGVADTTSSAKLLDTHNLKEAELARCVVHLVHANERLTAVQVSNLQEQLHLAHQASVGGSTVNLAMEGLTAQLTSIQESLQFACQDRDELKQRVIVLDQEKSDFLEELSRFKEETRHDSVKTQKVIDAAAAGLILASQERDELKERMLTLEQEKSGVVGDLSSLKEEWAQLKSEVPDVNNKCESCIVGLKEPVASRTTQGPVVQPVTQYVWKYSGDVCVSGYCNAELLECPPMTSGVHKWSIFVEELRSVHDVGLGVVSTVHSFEKKLCLGYDEGGWGYYRSGRAIHNERAVKKNLPKLQKGSKVTFILDLTGAGTLSASLDGKTFYQLFSDMLSVVRIVNPEGGFVPSVSLGYSNNRVRFLGFESVSA